MVTLETPLSRVRDVFGRDNVAVLREGQKVAGIVTKIDLIEFLAGRR